MKIALTGTSGIGKTTLAKALSEHYGLRLIEEDIAKVVYARDALKSIPKDKTKLLNKGIEKFLVALDEWLSKRMRYFGSDENFVEDRFCIDAISYLSTSGVGKFGDDMVKDLAIRCSEYTATYDIVVVPPISNFTTYLYQNESGLYRNNNLANKIINQSISIGLLEQFCVSPRLYLTLNLTTTEQRLAAVVDALETKVK